MKKERSCNSFPKTLIIDKAEITDTKTIAETCKLFCINLAKSCIKNSRTWYKLYTKQACTRKANTGLHKTSLGPFSDMCDNFEICVQQNFITWRTDILLNNIETKQFLAK